MMFREKIFFDADGSDAGGGSAASGVTTTVETTPVTPADSGDNSGVSTGTGTAISAAIDNGSADEGKKEIISGGMKLVVDPNGRRRVVTVNPAPQVQQPAAETKPAVAEPSVAVNTAAASAAGTALPVLPPEQPVQVPAVGIVGDSLANPSGTSVYSSAEMLLAMQLNKVDENRVPEAYRDQYAAFKAANHVGTGQEQGSTEQQPNTDAGNVEFYTKVNNMARQIAMQELGVTEDDIAAADYTDDQELKDKVENFNAAVEFNRAKIFGDLQAQQAQRQVDAVRAKAEHDSVYGEIQNYIQQVQQVEPNFNAIDVLMESRYLSLPYEQAKVIEPALLALKNHTLKREQLPILQKYYEDTRIDYYAKINGAGRIPTPVAKPPIVETPGNGGDLPPVKTDFSKLRNMNHREKQAYLSKYLCKRTK